MARAPSQRRPRKSSAGAKANSARGEHTLTLAGNTYCLRPSFEATLAIEDDLGLSLHELFRKANAMALTYSELGVICAAYIRAGAAEDDKFTAQVDASRIAELIYEEGTTGVYPVLTLLFADAISGGRTASGEARAVATTT
jgi:hypothetical protein